MITQEMITQEMTAQSRSAPAAPTRAARLSVYQKPRNPTERERGILTLLAEGLTQKQVAGHLGVTPRAVTSRVEKMRQRYDTPTNEALIALAVRLQWIALAIELHQDAVSSQPDQW